jgi:hypothetical protein
VFFSLWTPGYDVFWCKSVYTSTYRFVPKRLFSSKCMRPGDQNPDEPMVTRISQVAMTGWPNHGRAGAGQAHRTETMGMDSDSARDSWRTGSRLYGFNFDRLPVVCQCNQALRTETIGRRSCIILPATGSHTSGFFTQKAPIRVPGSCLRRLRWVDTRNRADIVVTPCLSRPSRQGRRGSA